VGASDKLRRTLTGVAAPPTILGLSFGYHDAAAALVADGRVQAAYQEERLSRKKGDASFPAQAIACCLRDAERLGRRLDAAVYYEQPLRKFDRIIAMSMRRPVSGFGYLRDAFTAWVADGRFDPRPRIARACGLPADAVTFVDHHAAHAASAFYCSPFDHATVIALDGVGEYDTATVWEGRGRDLRRLAGVRHPHSIGLFYSAFTAFLGFQVNDGEYKVMGMAAFGEPRYADAVRRLVRQAGCRFTLDMRAFEFDDDRGLPFTGRLVELFGPPRQPESPFDVTAGARPAVREESRHYADIAASVQRITEEFILEYAAAAVQQTGVRRLAFAGGVALNSLANGRLQRELDVDLYVHPAPGDAGGALGAALLRHHGMGGDRSQPLTTAYLGQEFGAEAAENALAPTGLPLWRFTDDAAVVAATADRLRAGQVLGWVQGRFEWGPRALGARSIIADPTQDDMQRRINEKIKFREPFRPFAPMVLAEHAQEYFEIARVDRPTQPETFMLSVARVRPDKRAVLPATTHADGTARVQLVHPDGPPLLRALLRGMAERGGAPVLLNTSFNRRGEPIVASPADAVHTFLWSGLDALVVGRHLLSKP
jgi:carbamoyltransferase